MSDEERRRAAGMVEDALARVFDAEVVVRLRADSPLDVVGMTPADAVCIADAVAEAAEASGRSCRLDDADFAHAATVADLVAAVQSRLAEEGPDAH